MSIKAGLVLPREKQKEIYSLFFECVRNRTRIPTEVLKFVNKQDFDPEKLREQMDGISTDSSKKLKIKEAGEKLSITDFAEMQVSGQKMKYDLKYERLFKFYNENFDHNKEKAIEVLLEYIFKPFEQNAELKSYKGEIIKAQADSEEVTKDFALLQEFHMVFLDLLKDPQSRMNLLHSTEGVLKAAFENKIEDKGKFCRLVHHLAIMAELKATTNGNAQAEQKGYDALCKMAFEQMIA